MDKKDTYLPYLTGVGFAVVFGFSFMFTRVALRSSTTLQLMGLRFLSAAVIMILLRIFQVIKINLTIKDALKILPITIFLPVLYFVGETYGIYYTNSSLSGMVISSIPIITAVLSFIFIKERLNRMQIVFMAISLIGVLIISIMTMSDAPETLLLGMMFLFIACFSAAIYNVMARGLTKQYSPLTITYMMMIIGAVVFNAAGLTDSAIKGYAYFAPLKVASFCWSLAFLGAISSIGGFFLMTYTVSRISASQNAMFANLVTVISIIAGGVFLKEQIFLYQIIGSVLIIAGVWGINRFALHPTPDRHIV